MRNILLLSKYILALIFIALIGAKVWGQATITTSLTQNIICQGGNISVNFIWADMSNGNETKTFFAQYENPVGTWNNIENFTISGSGNRSGSSSITALWPGNTGNFNIRVIRTVPTPQVLSNSSIVTVNPVSVGGSVSGSVTVCSGTNSTTLSLAGHTGAVTKWQSSTVANFSSSVTDITNTTTNLTATNLTITTYYRAVVQSGVCATANSSTGTVTVDPVSVGGTVSGSATVCSGTNSTTLSLSGHAGNVTKWQSSTVSNFSSSVTDISNTTTSLTATNLTTTTYYRAVVKRGVCATANSSTGTVTVNAIPAMPTIAASGPTTFCAGGSVTLTSSAGTSYLWSTGATTSSINVTSAGSYTVQVTNAGGCQSAASAATMVTIIANPTISLTKTNETCPGSNNGSITTTLSGGLSNIRYIKLTQKYTVDAWQQVAEIQAFEIFTGINVALSTAGATASASSVWINSSGPNYIASNVNNGVTTGTTFWHSGTNASVNTEWVMVDLKSGKNIDYLRVFNRTDCCADRGQKMLLELIDASNNLVYSKIVDLRGGGTNMVEVNIIDLNWNDNALAINRTGLNAGTYTLNYADAAGCSTSQAATITVTPANTVGTASSTPALCVNTLMTNITHTTTGAIGIGAATGLPAGVSAAWASNTITISGTPTAIGSFSYSIPLTGGCGSVNATGTIMVYASVHTNQITEQ